MNEKPIVNKKLKNESPFEYYLIKKVGKTIKKYGMVEKDDRILVGVSGGKDSFTLLKILNDRMGFYPNQYELLALHIISDIECEGMANPDAIEEFFQEHGYNYKIVRMQVELGDKGPSSFWCSWNRRRVLFEIANRLGYNKIALGHHRNDVIETLMLNMFYHAEISTMLPLQSLFEGRITIIRPLYNIPESDTGKFARNYKFQATSCRCPFESETKREMFKRMLKGVEKKHPKAMVNALRALENVKQEFLPGSTVKEDIDI
ncbi:MAG: tRNA 2-thiocytidine(32) synthetase TtcA [Spirochaetota bacterium]|nr:MAG: tRNA 2-thiocytidine(32) synthetase TtcA [Spirochaetota bacterium]